MIPKGSHMGATRPAKESKGKHHQELHSPITLNTNATMQGEVEVASQASTNNAGPWTMDAK